MKTVEQTACSRACGATTNSRLGILGVLGILLGLTALNVVLALFGCGGDSPDPTNWINRPRIIGMLSWVESDPTRSAALPGETLNLQILTTEPGQPVPTTYTFVVCQPRRALLGAAQCEPGVAPVAVFRSDTPVDALPQFSVAIPQATEANLLLVGAVCMGGQVRNDLMDISLREAVNPCAEGEGEGKLITGAVFVHYNPEQEFNHIPTIEEVRFDDRPWESEPPAELGQGCSGSELPKVYLSNDETHRLEVHAAPGSREPFLDPMAAPPGPDIEDLAVAFYATERGLRGHYSVIDADPGDTFAGATPVASLEFNTGDIEETPAANGRVIRFEIVMRDDRGGVSQLSRAVCLLP